MRDTHISAPGSALFTLSENRNKCSVYTDPLERTAEVCRSRQTTNVCYLIALQMKDNLSIL